MRDLSNDRTRFKSENGLWKAWEERSWPMLSAFDGECRWPFRAARNLPLTNVGTEFR